jgi:uncharacterized protein (DUF427 family)
VDGRMDAPGVREDDGPWIHIEPSPRRVRVEFGGETVVDSQGVMLLREAKRVPIYLFPKEDVRMDWLEESGPGARHPKLGDATWWTLKVGGRTAENAVWSYLNPSDEGADIRGCLAFEWTAMDAWIEEEEEVFVHARDPYKRVDVLKSARHVRVMIGGEVVAETRRPSLLLETGFPVRYYIPMEDVRMELFDPTRTSTRCPYKGTARYWSVRAGGAVRADIVWSYPDPIAKYQKIKDLLCFFDEHVDAIDVDGERAPKPVTPWS